MSYDEFLTAHNITQEFMEKTFLAPTLDILMGDVTLGESEIHGIGVFSNRTFSRNDFVCSTVLNGIRTIGGRYTNYSDTPNVRGSGGNGYFCMIATEEIIEDEEITIDYGQVFSLLKDKEGLCLG